MLLTLFLVSLAAFALTTFIEKAYSEIMSEALYMERDRLRMAAYSTLEATVAVLFNIQRMDGQLYAPAQGWEDPLDFGGIELPDGVDVQVEFVDEMGKISLPAADRDQLMRLFEVLGFDAIASQELTDALRGWVSQEEAQSSFEAHHLDYERAELPYQPPYRALNSFYELAAIAGFRDTFFNGQGNPNALFHQFTSLVSLYRFDTINVNAASPAVLQVWSDVGEQAAANIQTNQQYVTGLKPYFENLEEAEAQMGVPLGAGYGVSTQCLRVVITVSDGVADFVLSAIVAPAGAADGLRPPSQINKPVVESPGEEEDLNRNPRQRRESRQPGRTRQPDAGGNQQEPVPYPYRFLEIRENENILSLNPGVED